MVQNKAEGGMTARSGDERVCGELMAKQKEEENKQDIDILYLENWLTDGG